MSIVFSPIYRVNTHGHWRANLLASGSAGLLLVWCFFLFGYGINVGTLYRTEALRAIIGREALHGSWLTPRLYGEPFLSKPPGMYAAIAAASIPFGDVTAISARLPSAIAATITIFLFFFTFRRIVERKYALAGAMLMPVSFLWLDRAPSAEIDMLQLAWVSAALLFLLRAVEAKESNAAQRRVTAGSTEFHSVRVRSTHGVELRATGCYLFGRSFEPCQEWHVNATSWWLLSLLCVTAGFFTKWTAPAFFYAAAIPFLIWRRRVSLLWSWRHLLAATISIGLCLLWASAVIQQVGWPALRDTVFAEAAQRFGPQQSGRPYPWLESLSYPLQIMAANLPWSLLALFACRPAFFRQWDANGKRLLQLFHCWTWPNLLFWSLPAQHHVRYSMPMCPGLVGLGVMVAIAWARSFYAASRGEPSFPRSAWECRSDAPASSWMGAFDPRRRASKTAFPRRAWERGGIARRAWERGLFAIFALNPKRILLCALCSWIIIKIIYVEAIVPPRTAERRVRENAARLAELVPHSETLYVGKLKDEGILFYYNRPARRLQHAPAGRPFYAALIDAELRQATGLGSFDELEHLHDQQGAPITLVRFHE